jgi:hypothetical protein
MELDFTHLQASINFLSAYTTPASTCHEIPCESVTTNCREMLGPETVARSGRRDYEYRMAFHGRQPSSLNCHLLATLIQEQALRLHPVSHRT